MSKILTLLVFSFFVLASCQSKKVKVVEETWPDGKEKKVSYYSDEAKKEKIQEETFYPTGKTESRGELKDNLKHGTWTFFYPNGNKWSEGEFVDGKAHGFRKVYFENGQLRYEGTYKNDKETGEWTFYDENGKVVKKQKF